MRLPIHREWDSMTIAHNTISVDGQRQRQAQATGKLLDWKVGDGWTAVRSDAGPVYTTANLQRTTLLTSRYVLIIDRCESKDGQPHVFDFAYHNVGSESMLNAMDIQPYSFTIANGYQHLSHVKHGTTSDVIMLNFAADKRPSEEAHADSNSTPATYNSATGNVHSEKPEHAELQLEILPSPATEVLVGDAPSRNSQSPVPFVIARRSLMTGTFVTLLTPSAGASPGLHIRKTGGAQFQIESADSVDTFSDVKGFAFEHHLH
jgi:hypothetical protein